MDWRFGFAVAAGAAATVAGTLAATHGAGARPVVAALVAVLVGSSVSLRFAPRALRFRQPLVSAAGTRRRVPGAELWPACGHPRCAGRPRGALVRRAVRDDRPRGGRAVEHRFGCQVTRLGGVS